MKSTAAPPMTSSSLNLSISQWKISAVRQRITSDPFTYNDRLLKESCANTHTLLMKTRVVCACLSVCLWLCIFLNIPSCILWRCLLLLLVANGSSAGNSVGVKQRSQVVVHFLQIELYDRSTLCLTQLTPPGTDPDIHWFPSSLCGRRTKSS